MAGGQRLRAAEVGDAAVAERDDVLDSQARPLAVVDRDRRQALVLEAAVDEDDRLRQPGRLVTKSRSRRAVAVMKPSTWRARIASKSWRSRSGSLSVFAISDV